MRTIKSSPQPCVPIFGDECVVIEMGIGSIHPAYVLLLSRTQTFVLIQTPDTLQQSLPTKHFMKTCNAPMVMVRRIEKGSIAVSDLSSQP